jgi:hypothetical protein
MFLAKEIPSLRAQRSNPEQPLRMLDCFAALAMTTPCSRDEM